MLNQISHSQNVVNSRVRLLVKYEHSVEQKCAQIHQMNTAVHVKTNTVTLIKILQKGRSQEGSRMIRGSPLGFAAKSFTTIKHRISMFC